MKSITLKEKVLLDVKKLIKKSCSTKNSSRFETLHVAILKKYYNATDVVIDYHRHRVTMNIVLDDTLYNPRKANMNLPTIPTNIFFKDLKEFLYSCIDSDVKNLGFYAVLLRSNEVKEKLIKVV